MPRREVTAARHLDIAANMRWFAIVALLLGCARAHAEGKNPAIAVTISVGVTTLGAVALASDNGGAKLFGVGALLVGPSTGRWYAGEDSSSGIFVRTAGGVVGVVGVAMLVSAAESDCVPDDTPCSSQRSKKTVGTALALGGAAVWIGSTVVDVILARRAATHRVAVAPALVGSSPGVVFAGHF